MEELGTWLKGFFAQTISFFPATVIVEYLEHTAVSDSRGHEQPIGKELKAHYRLIYNQRFGLHICQSFPIKNHSSIPCPPWLLAYPWAATQSQIDWRSFYSIIVSMYSSLIHPQPILFWRPSRACHWNCSEKAPKDAQIARAVLSSCIFSISLAFKTVDQAPLLEMFLPNISWPFSSFSRCSFSGFYPASALSALLRFKLLGLHPWSSYCTQAQATALTIYHLPPTIPPNLNQLPKSPKYMHNWTSPRCPAGASKSASQCWVHCCSL